MNFQKKIQKLIYNIFIYFIIIYKIYYYKLAAVLYYLSYNDDLRKTCKIFDCKFQSLARWIE
jgi:hypothetical protein